MFGIARRIDRGRPPRKTLRCQRRLYESNGALTLCQSNGVSVKVVEPVH